MQPQTPTDHIALLSLMICGTLIKRMNELGQLDEPTAHRLHRLIGSVRTHAESHDIHDLGILFENIDLSLGGKSA